MTDINFGHISSGCSSDGPTKNGVPYEAGRAPRRTASL